MAVTKDMIKFLKAYHPRFYKLWRKGKHRPEIASFLHLDYPGHGNWWSPAVEAEECKIEEP